MERALVAHWGAAWILPTAPGWWCHGLQAGPQCPARLDQRPLSTCKRTGEGRGQQGLLGRPWAPTTARARATEGPRW